MTPSTAAAAADPRRPPGRASGGAARASSSSGSSGSASPWSSRSSFPRCCCCIFGSVFNQDIAPGVTFSQYFVAGMIATGFVNSGFQALAIGIAFERDSGGLKLLSGTPMPRAAYFVGKFLLVLVSRSSRSPCSWPSACCFFGVNLPDASGWFTFGWVAFLGLLSSALLGIAFSSVPRDADSAPALVTPIVLVLQFISGVFFVYTELPHVDAAASRRSSRSSGSPRGCARSSCPTRSRPRRPPGRWQLGLGRRRAGHLDRRRGRAVPADVPLAAPRRATDRGTPDCCLREGRRLRCGLGRQRRQPVRAPDLRRRCAPMIGVMP